MATSSVLLGFGLARIQPKSGGVSCFRRFLDQPQCLGMIGMQMGLSCWNLSWAEENNEAGFTERNLPA